VKRGYRGQTRQSKRVSRVHPGELAIDSCIRLDANITYRSSGLEGSTTTLGAGFAFVAFFTAGAVAGASSPESSSRAAKKLDVCKSKEYEAMCELVGITDRSHHGGIQSKVFGLRFGRTYHTLCFYEPRDLLAALGTNHNDNRDTEGTVNNSSS
jgi:hypothetical protein